MTDLVFGVKYTTENSYFVLMLKPGQFTTKCKGNRVIALKSQISLW